MNNIISKNIIRFIVLIFLQISVMNNIYLGGYANLFVYILFVLMLPTNINKVLLLFLSFMSGLVVDIFSCSLGFHAFSATLVGFARILFANRILTKDDNSEIENPSVKSVSFSTYIFFMLILTFIYCLSYYTIEAFCFYDFYNVIIRTLLSTIVSSAFMLAFEFLFVSSKRIV